MRPRAPLPAAVDGVANAVASVASASSGAGAASAGSADVLGFFRVQASARGQGAFTFLTPAMPSNSSSTSTAGSATLRDNRMSADVVGGIMCFELFFQGILETGGLQEQPVLGGLTRCRHKNVGIYAIQNCSVGEGTSPQAV